MKDLMLPSHVHQTMELSNVNALLLTHMEMHVTKNVHLLNQNSKPHLMDANVQDKERLLGSKMTNVKIVQITTTQKKNAKTYVYTHTKIHWENG